MAGETLAGYGAAGKAVKWSGKEFGAAIPARALPGGRGGALDTFLTKTKLNGNHVPIRDHALSDPVRYGRMPKPWRDANPLRNPFERTLDPVQIPTRNGGGCSGRICCLTKRRRMSVILGLLSVLFGRPRLTALESRVISTVSGKLSSAAKQLFDAQMNQVNRIQRLSSGKEANFYTLRRGKPSLEERFLFPLRTETLLARVHLNLGRKRSLSGQKCGSSTDTYSPWISTRLPANHRRRRFMSPTWKSCATR